MRELYNKLERILKTTDAKEKLQLTTSTTDK